MFWFKVMNRLEVGVIMPPETLQELDQEFHEARFRELETIARGEALLRRARAVAHQTARRVAKVIQPNQGNPTLPCRHTPSSVGTGDFLDPCGQPPG